MSVTPPGWKSSAVSALIGLLPASIAHGKVNRSGNGDRLPTILLKPNANALEPTARGRNEEVPALRGAGEG
jgi:hypothetical protein